MNSAALDRPRPHERDLDREVVEVLRPRAQQRSASARGSRSGRRRRCRLPGSRRRRPCRRAESVRGRSALPCSTAISSTQSSTAESIPSPSRSIFRKPASAHESLSHWQSWRPSIAAGCTGTSSTSGRVEITIPPGCWEMWRGKPPISPQSLANARQRGGRAFGVGVRQLRRAPPRPGTRSSRRSGARAARARRTAGRAPCRRRGSRRASGRSRSSRRAPRARGRSARMTRDDQLLADVAREVEVDVGDRGELTVEEAAEREPGRAPGRRARGRSGSRRSSRPSCPARGPAAGRCARPSRAAHLEGALARELEHLPVEQEEPGEAELVDQRQLLVEPLRARRLCPFASP